MILDDFEAEVGRIQVRFYQHPAPDLTRSLSILAEEFAEVMREGLECGRPESKPLKALRDELLQLAAYGYHLAMRVERGDFR